MFILNASRRAITHTHSPIIHFPIKSNTMPIDITNVSQELRVCRRALHYTHGVLMSGQDLYVKASGRDDHVDELLEAGPFAHGSELLDGAMRVNRCQCARCEARREELGIIMRDDDGRPFPIFIDDFGRVAGCPCDWCKKKN
jgi:hypothetical protein